MFVSLIDGDFKKSFLWLNLKFPYSRKNMIKKCKHLTTKIYTRKRNNSISLCYRPSYRLNSQNHQMKLIV